MNFAGTQLESYDGELTICGVPPTPASTSTTRSSSSRATRRRRARPRRPTTRATTTASPSRAGSSTTPPTSARPEVDDALGPDPDDWKVPPSTVDTDLFAHRRTATATWTAGFLRGRRAWRSRQTTHDRSVDTENAFDNDMIRKGIDASKAPPRPRHTHLSEDIDPITGCTPSTATQTRRWNSRSCWASGSSCVARRPTTPSSTASTTAPQARARAKWSKVHINDWGASFAVVETTASNWWPWQGVG